MQIATQPSVDVLGGGNPDFLPAERDAEYQLMLEDARLAQPKLWKPGQINHRTKGGNVIVRVLPGSFSAAEIKRMQQLQRDYRAGLYDGPGALPKPIGGGAGPSAWTFTNNSRTNMLNGNQAIGTDTFKMALFQSTSNIGATSNAYSGLTNEVANANGYTTGGASVTESLSGTTTVTVAITDASWTASGGSIVARFAVVYEVAGNVQVYCTLDSAPADVTVASGNTLTISGANNLFTLS